MSTGFGTASHGRKANMSDTLQFSLLRITSPAIHAACVKYRRLISDGLEHEGMSPGNYLYKLAYGNDGSAFKLAPEDIREFYEATALEALKPEFVA